MKLIRILIESKKKSHIRFSQFYRTSHLIQKLRKIKKNQKNQKKNVFTTKNIIDLNVFI